MKRRFRFAAITLALAFAQGGASAQPVPRNINPDARKPDPDAKVLAPGDFPHSPVFSPRFDGPYEKSTAPSQGRSPVNGALPPASLRLSQSRIAAVTVNVIDMEAQRAWYERIFGMKVITTFHRHGVLYEYLMGWPDGPPGGPRLALTKDQRPPGYNNYGRLGIDVPDVKGFAEFLYSQGVLMREAQPGRVYFIVDPEGNSIELFSLPKPAAETTVK